MYLACRTFLAQVKWNFKTQWPSQSRQVQIQKCCSKIKNSEVKKKVLSQSNVICHLSFPLGNALQEISFYLIEWTSRPYFMIRCSIKLKDIEFLGGPRTYSVNFFSASLGQTELFCNRLTKMHELFGLQSSTCCSYTSTCRERCRKHVKIPTNVQIYICICIKKY